MTPTEEAVLEQMAYLVYHENRPFCVNDFLRFEYNGDEKTPNQGTIRNIFSKFNKEGRIEFCFYSVNAYYSLKGKPFRRNSMTLDHTWGRRPPLSPNHPLYKVLKNQIWSKEACHNWRLRVDEVPDIYNTVSKRGFPTNPVSQDIRVPYPIKDNVALILTIHKTNTISVALSCTKFPIPLDYSDYGLPRLFSVLARCEGVLHGLTIDNLTPIPHYNNWLINMRHFNMDGLKDYRGEMFYISVEKLDHTVEIIYSKDFGNKKIRPRWELQDYPNKTVKQVKQEIDNSFDTTTSFNDSNPDLPNIGTNANVRE